MRYAIRRTIIVIIIILCGHNHHAVHPIDDLSSPPKNHQKTALIANVHEAAAIRKILYKQMAKNHQTRTFGWVVRCLAARKFFVS